MPNYLDFGMNNTALAGFIHQFQGSILEADHPPIEDNSNKVATTGWVSNLLLGTPLHPKVIQSGLLSVNITEGYITDLMGDNHLVNATTTPISVVGGSTEYVYIRYVDLKPVISTIQPSPSLGYLLAKVISDTTTIIEIIDINDSPFGWASVDSPVFTGDPQVPHPEPGDYDNSIPTTKWVKDEIASIVGDDMVYKPTISISPLSTVLWSQGVLNIEGIKYDVLGGAKTFNVEDSGLYVLRVKVEPGPSTIVEVTTNLTNPTTPYINLATLNVNSGVIEGLSIINPEVPPGDLGNSYTTTSYVFNTLLKMVQGFDSPILSLNLDKTVLSWTSGLISVNHTEVSIVEESLDITTYLSGSYYIYGLQSQSSLSISMNLPSISYKVIAKMEIFDGKVKAIYPVLPGFGG